MGDFFKFLWASRNKWTLLASKIWPVSGIGIPDHKTCKSHRNKKYRLCSCKDSLFKAWSNQAIIVVFRIYKNRTGKKNTGKRSWIKEHHLFWKVKTRTISVYCAQTKYFYQFLVYGRKVEGSKCYKIDPKVLKCGFL